MTDPHDDLAFPTPAPLDAAAADAEAAQIAEALAANRRAVGLGVVAGFVIATVVFFAMAFAFPNIDRDVVLIAMALGAGGFVGLGVWAVTRSKRVVFDTDASAPEAKDEGTRQAEARGEAYRRRSTRALLVGGVTFLVLGPGVLQAWSLYLDAQNELRDWWAREEIGTGRSLVVLAAAAALGALATRVLHPKVDVLAELGGLGPGDAPRDASRDERNAPLTAAERTELEEVVRAERQRQRTEGLRNLAAGATFVGVLVAVYFASGSAVFASLLALGATVGVVRWLSGQVIDEPGAMADTLAGFRTTLASTGSITLEAGGGLEGMVARRFGVALNRWTLLDGTGAALACATEVDLPLWRRFLPFRPRTIAVECSDGRALEVVRSGRPFADGWTLRIDGEARGQLRPGWLTLGLSDASGVERLRLKRPLLSRSRRLVLRRSEEIAQLRWERPGMFASPMAHTGLVVELPKDATEGDRALLLAAALVLDLDRA